MLYTLGCRKYAPITLENAFPMRLTDDARRCVVFIGDERQGEDGQPDIDPKGTGFFVTFGEGVTYLATAAHIARAYEQRPFVVRLNAWEGGSRLLPIDPEANEICWHNHPMGADCLDIAIARFQPPDWANVQPLPSRQFLTPAKMASKDIGAGDLAYIVGLFRKLHGQVRNLPIVHTGHVAMLPGDERLPMKDTVLNVHLRVEGYLVEAQAFPGCSGSPVFVRRSLELPGGIPQPNIPDVRAWSYGAVFLLGVYSGAWDAHPTDDVAEAFDLRETDRVPLGVGIVSPAYRLVEILDQPELEQARLQEYEQREIENAAELD